MTSNTFLTNNSNARRAGTGGGQGLQRVNQPVLGFTLPTIPVGEEITAADFTITLDTAALTGSPVGTGSIVLSLMSQTSLAGFSAADFTEDASSLGAGTFIATIAEADVANNSVESFSLSGAALMQIAALYDLAGNPSQTEVFFRLSTTISADTTDPDNDNDRFNFARNDDGGGNLVTRSLIFTTTPIPEPSVALLGLVGMMSLTRRKR